jgi:hypothetical protein
MAIESGIEIAAEMSTSTMELTRRGPSAALTGCCEASDVPRSPWSSPPSHEKYWATTFWSRFS